MTNQTEYQNISASPSAELESIVPVAGYTPDRSTLLRPTTQSPSIGVARSQSPAKRLKSEEPPASLASSATLADIPEPMDEDVVPPVEGDRGETPVGMLDGNGGSTDGNGEVVFPGAMGTPSTATSTASTAATIGSNQPSSTSVTSISSVSVPSVEEQVQLILQARWGAQVKEGDVGYVISGPWLKKLLAKCPDSETGLSKEDAEAELGPIDNSDLVDTAQVQGQSKKKSDDREVDEDIAIPEDFVPIKPGSLSEDFEILSEDTWNLLVSWHGLAESSPVIKRKAVNTSESDNPNIQFELYPPTFTVYKLRDPSAGLTKEILEGEKAQSPQKVVTGKTEGFQRFLKKVKKLAGVDSAKKIRLWRVFGGSSEDETEAVIKPPKRSVKEKGSGTFKQMVIDLQTFMDLNLGAERELVDLKDQSNDEKYNGSLQIGAAGLGAGGTIVIEEQSSDGEWISEKPTKSAKKFGQSVTVAQNGKNVAGIIGVKKKVPSRPASPSGSNSNAVIRGGVLTRGREKREGRPVGKCGLSNLGNTCYMNSALQCLRSVEELSKYFLTDEYERELNPNNPLSHNGKIAKAYASLLKSIFSQTCPASLSPREFKSTVGRFGPSFSGYGQQDSQEFLAFLLDGLHEDLNRIQRKPYIEKPESTDEMVGDNDAIARLAQEHWNIYKQRNDSAVADLFGGLYKSTLVCPTCEKVSITFDPFMDLTLPLPVENIWSREIYFFPKDSERNLMRLPVEMDKNSSIKALKEYVANKLGIEPGKVMASEVYKTKFFKHYEDYQSVSEQIQNGDFAYVYELDDAPTNFPTPKSKKAKKSGLYSSGYGRYDDDDDIKDPDAPECERLLVPVFHKVHKTSRFNSGPSLEGFGLPFFIVVNREEARNLEVIMAKLVEKYQVLTTRDLYENMESSEGGHETDEAVEVRVEEEKDGEEDRDGYVDVSMKDASSIMGSETAEMKPPKQGGRRALPPNIDELFSVKVTKRKSGDAPVLTGWQTLDVCCDIRDRLNHGLPLSPPPRRQGFFPSSGLSGRVSPISDTSDGDADKYEDAQEPQQDMMQDASDDEEMGVAAYDGSGPYTRPSFNTVGPVGFYGNSSGNSSKRTFKTPTRSPSPTIHASDEPLIKWGEGLICEWTTKGHDAIFGGKSEDDFRGQAAWDGIPLSQDRELDIRRRRREDRKNKGIHLEDCLDEFAKDEILSEEDPWYCPRCKVHRRASKKFELWKCPDILAIHLKRFSSSRNFRDKIDVLIDCPVEGLNLENRVGQKEPGKSLVYDLFAVDNHYGGLGGGHYTAFAKNWVDNKWYHCDDSSVREISDAKVITSAAYLLFYRRRSDKPLGGPDYERILSEIPSGSPVGSVASSRNTSPSPAGEGGPSDDSSISISINGRSLGGGVGGLSTMYGPHEVGNSNLWGSSNAADDDEPLPPYSENGIGMEMVLVIKSEGSASPEGKPPSVGFEFGTSISSGSHPTRDLSDTEMGGGVFIGSTPEEATESSVDIISVGDEESLLPSEESTQASNTGSF